MWRRAMPQSVAGDAYYTAAAVNDSANTVDVYLASAPQSIIDQLQATHPGTYVIHNDATHSLSVLLRLQHACSFRSSFRPPQEASTSSPLIRLWMDISRSAFRGTAMSKRRTGGAARSTVQGSSRSTAAHNRNTWSLLIGRAN